MDTLEEWKMAAEVKTALLRQSEARCEMFKMVLEGVLGLFSKSSDYCPDSPLIKNAMAMLEE